MNRYTNIIISLSLVWTLVKAEKEWQKCPGRDKLKTGTRKLYNQTKGARFNYARNKLFF